MCKLHLISRAARCRTRELLALLAAGLTLCVPALGQQTTSSQPASQPAETQPVSPVQDLLDEGDIELLELEVPVVVTATRREQKITHVPYAISVITAGDIRRSGARSIADALRLAPGVDVADLSVTQWAISPRGMHGLLANYTLVLVDGRQVFDSVSGGTMWGSWPFQLEDIERIEVIRGPGGVTWGANAANGVINIITKDPRDQLGLTFTAGGGSRGTHKEHLSYAFADEKLRFRISGEYEASDGFLRGGSLLRNLEDDQKTGRIGLHAIYDAGPDDTLTFSAGSLLLDGGFSPTPFGTLFRTRNPGSQSSFVLGKWAHRVSDDNEFELTGYANDFQTSNGVHSIDYRYQQLALQFLHTFKPADAHTLTWGIDTRVDLSDSSNSDPFMASRDFVSTAIIGLYFQDEWQFAPKWTLNLGGRVDYESYGGFQPSARAALAYALTDDSVLYGAVSRSFSMPAATARFLNTPMAGGIAWVTADRDVSVRTLIAYELGHRCRLFDRMDMSFNLFWHEYADFSAIPVRPGPPGLMRTNFERAGDQSLYGLEWDARFAATENLALLANYTFQQNNWRSSVPFHQTELVSPPKHKFMVGTRYSPIDDLHLSSHLYWVDAVKAPNPINPFAPRQLDSYFRLDLFGEYEFCEDRAAISVGVRNLIDSHHPEGGTQFLNDAEVPRMIYAQLRLSFD